VRGSDPGIDESTDKQTLLEERRSEIPNNPLLHNEAVGDASFHTAGFVDLGLHPLFVNHLDTDTPTSDMSTVEARWAAITMLRQGKFTRRVSPPGARLRGHRGQRSDLKFTRSTTARSYRSASPSWSAA
jgi:hypothetical protein